MIEITDEQFSKLVSEGMDRIPDRFLKQIENVAVLVADLPTAEQLEEQGMDDPYELLGLYEGVPLTERGENYGIGDMILPDKITIFMLPTIAEAKELRAEGRREEIEELVREIVHDTVWHEVGHYFGWDDAALHEREEQGTNRFKQ
jgi:predicted Zn-dependent protease with MMP-like domain